MENPHIVILCNRFDLVSPPRIRVKYPYKESEVKPVAQRTLLIPSLLDDCLPLLQHVFASKRWHPVLLTEAEGIADLGLRHVHSDLCYPAHLVTGQILAALASGRYDTRTCGVLVGQAGDECRGSCLIRILRRVLDRAGYPDVALLSLNVQEIEPENRLLIRPAMVFQAAAAALWSDTLSILRDQTRPREALPGSARALWQQWVETLGADMRRPLSRRFILRRCREMAESFRRLEQSPRPVQKVAIVGEIYTKYCRLGNWDLREYLDRHRCQTATCGITWYALYYLDSHGVKGPLLQRLVFRIARLWLESAQKRMLQILQAAGFETLPPFRQLKAQAVGYAPLRITLADGWLITAEATAWAKLGYRKILCVQPFACLPGHIFGKGQYARLQRKLPHTRLVSVDYDASTGEGTVESRIRMLLDEELPPL